MAAFEVAIIAYVQKLVGIRSSVSVMAIDGVAILTTALTSSAFLYTDPSRDACAPMITFSDIMFIDSATAARHIDKALIRGLNT